ncbi:MAG: hypothetical protein BWX63_02463 [Bacteroidetes bacterium ADurb.Bin041]|nr:MAG: hypothetical protein BWX63_02463 [Bacteroidetes bacterium ADurb.Bin041]
MTNIINKSSSLIYRSSHLSCCSSWIVNLINSSVTIIKKICSNIIHMSNITFTHISLAATTFCRGNSNCFFQPGCTRSNISFIIYTASDLSFQFSYCLCRKTTHKDIIIIIIPCQKCIGRITSSSGISKSGNLRRITNQLHKHQAIIQIILILYVSFNIGGCRPCCSNIHNIYSKTKLSFPINPGLNSSIKHTVFNN